MFLKKNQNISNNLKKTKKLKKNIGKKSIKTFTSKKIVNCQENCQKFLRKILSKINFFKKYFLNKFVKKTCAKKGSKREAQKIISKNF